MSRGHTVTPLFDFLLVFHLTDQPTYSSSLVLDHGFTNGLYWPKKMKRRLCIQHQGKLLFFPCCQTLSKAPMALIAAGCHHAAVSGLTPRARYFCILQMDSYNCYSALIQVRLVEKTKAVFLRFSFSQDRGQKQRLQLDVVV